MEYQISIVVPFYNEEDTIGELCRRLREVLDKIGRRYEVICVDDGSADRTLERLIAEHRAHPQFKVIKLRGNFGQTAGLAVGFHHAGGEIILAMDGDLQHCPEEIPMFLEKIDEGYDIVSGWRHQRRDGFVLRQIPSRIANRMLARASGVDINDFGTTFKAYRSDVIKALPLYGDFHRFIPGLAAELRPRIAEIKITDMPRAAGKSKYGISRTFTVFFDIFRLRFLLHYINKPLQTFGSVGGVISGIGALILLYLAKVKLIDKGAIMTDHGPMFLAAILAIMLGAQLISLGLLGEMIHRLSREQHPRYIHYVGKKYGFEDDV